jgi:Pyridoxamine 5'-phosphate oxidase
MTKQIKIVNAMNGVPGMNQLEINEFLSKGKSLLRLGTVDQKGEPMIHPVWYHYEDNVLYVWTGQNTRKARNVSSRAKYFSIDTDNKPYKGVKGKGTATIIHSEKVIGIAKKIIIKYLGNLGNDYGKMLADAKPGSEAMIEIVPDYYSVWDYGKRS